MANKMKLHEYGKIFTFNINKNKFFVIYMFLPVCIFNLVAALRSVVLELE
jgi:hypothetical protein